MTYREKIRQLEQARIKLIDTATKLRAENAKLKRQIKKLKEKL